MRTGTNDLASQIEQACKYIRSKTRFVPKIAIILGTGLGDLAKSIKREKVISYTDIPHFVRTTALTHKGELIFGTLCTKSVVVLEGRFHCYEGYSMKEITFPVRVAKALGAKILIVSSATGGLNPLFRKGDLVILDDHINLMGNNPLIGPNDESLGPRFPDMSQPYDKELLKLAFEVALENKIPVQKGVYVAVSGPNLETRAEYRFLRIIGADVVGMSTVPEVIVAVHSGLKVLGISIVTDMGLPDAIEPVNIKEIIRIAQEAEPKMTLLIKKFIERVKVS